MKRVILIFLVLIPFLALTGCLDSSDSIQREQQELLLREGTSQIGMPAIKNFRERKLLKDILEMRDQEGLVTYTYMQSSLTGKLIFLGESVGYGIPYSTQFSNPQKKVYDVALPQADPNGLFSPASSEGNDVRMGHRLQ